MTTEGADALLTALPPEIEERLRALPPERDLIEVVMDLGRRPEARHVAKWTFGSIVVTFSFLV